MKKVLYLGLDPSRYPQTDRTLIHYPIIQTIPRPPTDLSIQQTFQTLKTYTHLIITSQTTTKILINYLPLFNFSLQDLTQKTLIAVGQATSLHLTQFGLSTLTAKEETSEGITQLLEQLDLKNASVWWPHSAQSRPVIRHFFQQRQWSLTETILYEIQPVFHSFKPDLEEIDEIVFTSPSTIDAFLLIFGTLPSNKQLISIGPITKNYLSQRLSV